MDIKKVHYVGKSLGGNIGYELLKSNPNQLLSFTTFGTTAQLNKSAFTIAIMKFTYRLMNSKTLAKLSSSVGVTEYSKDKIRSMVSQTSKSTILNIVPNLADFNYLDVIKSSKVPCMIIRGEKDNEINKVLNSTIKEFEHRGDFQLNEFNSAGHFANLDNPDLFNKELYNFIKKLDKWFKYSMPQIVKTHNNSMERILLRRFASPQNHSFQAFALITS